jgi:hypothetical protein
MTRLKVKIKIFSLLFSVQYKSTMFCRRVRWVFWEFALFFKTVCTYYVAGSRMYVKLCSIFLLSKVIVSLSRVLYRRAASSCYVAVVPALCTSSGLQKYVFKAFSDAEGVGNMSYRNVGISLQCAVLQHRRRILPFYLQQT